MKHFRPIIAGVVISLFGFALSFCSGISDRYYPGYSIGLSANSADRNSASKDQGQLEGHEIRCIEASEPFEINLCDVLLKLKDESDSVTKNAFKVTFAVHDLNSDGQDEIVAWESSWAGTSGGRLWFLQYKGNDLLISYAQDFGVWPPIGVQSKQNNGWFDLVAVVAGGGVERHVVKISHNGKKYEVIDEPVDENDVTILIRTNIEQTVFGPRPK